MEIIAESKDVRISARKVRLVANAVRKLSLEKALVALPLMKQRPAIILYKTLRSALANAAFAKQNQENLVLKSIEISDGSALKRFHPATRGRTYPYKKRSCHIKIILTERNKKASSS